MKINTYFIFSAAVLLLSTSCGTKPEKNLNELNWLLGEWTGGRDGMVLSEIWKKESPQLFSGKGIVHVDNDTLFHETLKIEIKGDDIFYIAKVPANKEPVAFRLIYSENNTWKFENKKHDFPQQIKYSFFPPDSLASVISGNSNGKLSKEEFHFKKSM